MKFTIDCFQPVDDKVLDMATFEKFLKDRIKVRVPCLCVYTEVIGYFQTASYGFD